ncbi:MAG: glycerol-3-phosphate 1-O-acyltransferase PlsY [candidate division WOR-3 bacterium]
MVLRSLLSLLFGFICGSIPFGYLVGLIRGVDIRTRGSGNIGFTNVQRVLGWTWAVPVLILDIAKGILPTFFAFGLGLIPVLTGFGTITGHVFTPWLSFRGGKGVATTIGVAALLCPRSLIFGLAIYFLLLLISGFISLSSIALALALPALTALFYPGNLPLLLFSLGCGLIILIRHIANIRRLLSRTEPRLGLWLKLFRKA